MLVRRITRLDTGIEGWFSVASAYAFKVMAALRFMSTSEEGILRADVYERMPSNVIEGKVYWGDKDRWGVRFRA